MTAAEYLLALSPLASGTAAAHLLAIELGTGGGAEGETVYVYRDRLIPQSDLVRVALADEWLACEIEDALAVTLCGEIEALIASDEILVRVESPTVRVCQ